MTKKDISVKKKSKSNKPQYTIKKIQSRRAFPTDKQRIKELSQTISKEREALLQQEERLDDAKWAINEIKSHLVSLYSKFTILLLKERNQK